MRSSKSRSRNKSNRQRSIGNIINRVFDSSGPEGKVRGTPQQIIEKYLALARDAQLGNDRVAEQNFLQHAEHYTRMLGEAQRELAREQEERNRTYQQQGGNAPQGGQALQNGNGGGNGHGYRDRPERDQREPVAEPARAEEPRYEGAPVMMPGFFAPEDDGPGLVETPETRQAEPAASQPSAQPAAQTAAQTGAETGTDAPEAKAQKSARGRAPARKPKPQGDAAEGGSAQDAPAPHREKRQAPKAQGEKSDRAPRSDRAPKPARAEAEKPAADAAPAPQED